MLPYDQLLAMLPKLRFKDDTFFRTKGLTRLAKAYDAYPVHESGRKLYCLLLKGVEIPTARKLTPDTAVTQIIVLQDSQGGLAKVWPTADSAKAATAAPAVATAVLAVPAAAVAASAVALATSPDGSTPAASSAPRGPLGSLEIVED